MDDVPDAPAQAPTASSDAMTSGSATDGVERRTVIGRVCVVGGEVDVDARGLDARKRERGAISRVPS